MQLRLDPDIQIRLIQTKKKVSVVAPTKHSSHSSLRREKSVSLSHACLGKLPRLRRQLQHQCPGAPRLQLPWSFAVVHRLQDDSPPPPAGEEGEKREGKEVPPLGTHSGITPQILLPVTWSNLAPEGGPGQSGLLGRPAALLFTLWSSPQSLPSTFSIDPSMHTGLSLLRESLAPL